MRIINMGELYSNAFNFNSYLSAGVDPRTGQYSASLNLITLSPFNIQGSSYLIKLSFSIFNDLNNGFGTGWNLSSTRYDLKNRLLTRNNGESFKSEVVIPGKEVVFLDKKLNTFRLLSQSHNLFYLYNKDGTVETLQKVGLNSELLVTTAVTFENGESYDFIYGRFILGSPCLTEIRYRNTGTVIFQLDYLNQVCSRARYPDDNGNMLTILFKYNNNQLTYVSLPFSSLALSVGYKFNYQTLQNTFLAISHFHTPTGYYEQVQYDATGMRLTNTKTIPCVTMLHAFPGNEQPAIIKNYQYSPTFNFTGFSSGRNQIDPEQDNLYLVTGNYNYSSTENIVENGNIVSSIERTFNRFHLLILEQKTEGNKRLTRQFTYNETTGLNYYWQPANLQLLARQDTIYTDLSSGAFRQEKELYQTDIWGNTLLTRYVDGTQEINEYYPAAGEEDNCPADPLGFSRFLKSTIKKPAYGNAPNKIAHYFWKNIPTFEGSVITKYICLDRHELFGLLTKRYSYFNSPEQRQHSLLSRIDSSMNNLETISTFAYQFTDSTINCTETTIGHDSVQKQFSTTTALISKRKLKILDENNTMLDYRYTPEGLLSEEIIAADTYQEVKRLYTWQYPSSTEGNLWPIMTETTPEGINRRIRFDGMSRICSIEEQDDDAIHLSENYTGTYRETLSRQFNVQGLVTSETNTDWLWDLSASNQQRQLSPIKAIKHHLYDGWGGLISTSYNDGRIEEDSYDPISMTSRQCQPGLGIMISQKNLFGKIEIINMVKSDKTICASTSYEYDGFGRKITEINSTGDITRYELDIFDRLVRTTLPDGTRMDSTYASFSADKFTTGLSINNHKFAEASYDGLGRVSSDIVGGRITQYGYHRGESLPNKIITSDNNYQSRRYEYLLGGVLSDLQTPQVNQHFSYSQFTGKLKKASDGQLKNILEYYPSGKIKNEQLNEEEHNKSSCEYKYSMLGKLQYYCDALRKEHFYEYDDYGRLKQFKQGGQSVTYTYDNFSRLENILVVGEDSTLNTNIGYDEFNREIRRAFSTQDSMEILTQSYTTEGKLSRRILIRDNLILNNEQFEYDSNGRLHHYYCSGIESPKDSSKRKLLGQTYHYDYFGNICRMENLYSSGSESIHYEFNKLDPTQLISISDRTGVIHLQYDEKGNLIRDEKKQILIYDSKNRLLEVRSQSNQLVCRYQYDAQDKLIVQYLPDGQINRYYYANHHISNAEIGNKKITWFNDSTYKSFGHMSETSHQKKQYQYGLLTNGTPCLVQSGDAISHLSYTPYGFRCLFSNSPGQTGIHIDPVTGWYFLDNGYRVFNPTLMRFHSPDSWSPFNKGNINPYIYNLGDPINRIGINGHPSTSGIIGITFDSISLSIAIRGATLEAKNNNTDLNNFTSLTRILASIQDVSF